MTFRTPAIVAVLAMLGLAAGNRLSAQPVAPPRAPSNAFGSFFGYGSSVVPNAGYGGYNNTINNIPRAGALNPYGAGVGYVGPFGGSPYTGPYTPFILNRQPVVFNNRGHWYAQGGYDAIAEKLFTTMAADRFLLEYDDERSGTFEPLRFVPKTKTVVLGLVSSKRPQLETRDELIQRIKEAAKYFPLENLGLSPQCGFASTMEGNLITEDEQWAKLRLVAETARRVWEEAG